MQSRVSDAVGWLLRAAVLAIVGLVFVQAGWSKITAPDGHLEFEQAIMAYELVERDFARWSSYVLPWTEVVLGAGLMLTALIQPLRWLFGVPIFILLSVFMGALMNAYGAGKNFPCGCTASPKTILKVIDAGLEERVYTPLYGKPNDRERILIVIYRDALLAVPLGLVLMPRRRRRRTTADGT